MRTNPNPSTLLERMPSQLSDVKQNTIPPYEVNILINTIRAYSSIYHDFYAKGKDDRKSDKKSLCMFNYNFGVSFMEMIANIDHREKLIRVQIGFTNANFEMGKGDAFFSIIYQDKDGLFAYGLPSFPGYEPILSYNTRDYSN